MQKGKPIKRDDLDHDGLDDGQHQSPSPAVATTKPKAKPTDDDNHVGARSVARGILAGGEQHRKPGGLQPGMSFARSVTFSDPYDVRQREKAAAEGGFLSKFLGGGGKPKKADEQEMLSRVFAEAQARQESEQDDDHDSQAEGEDGFQEVELPEAGAGAHVQNGDAKKADKPAKQNGVDHDPAQAPVYGMLAAVVAGERQRAESSSQNGVGAGGGASPGKPADKKQAQPAGPKNEQEIWEIAMAAYNTAEGDEKAKAQSAKTSLAGIKPAPEYKTKRFLSTVAGEVGDVTKAITAFFDSFVSYKPDSASYFAQLNHALQQDCLSSGGVELSQQANLAKQIAAFAASCSRERPDTQYGMLKTACTSTTSALGNALVARGAQQNVDHTIGVIEQLEFARTAMDEPVKVPERKQKQSEPPARHAADQPHSSSSSAAGGGSHLSRAVQTALHETGIGMRPSDSTDNMVAWEGGDESELGHYGDAKGSGGYDNGIGDREDTTVVHDEEEYGAGAAGGLGERAMSFHVPSFAGAGALQEMKVLRVMVAENNPESRLWRLALELSKSDGPETTQAYISALVNGDAWPETSNAKVAEQITGLVFGGELKGDTRSTVLNICNFLQEMEHAKAVSGDIAHWVSQGKIDAKQCYGTFAAPVGKGDEAQVVATAEINIHWTKLTGKLFEKIDALIGAKDYAKAANIAQQISHAFDGLKLAAKSGAKVASAEQGYQVLQTACNDPKSAIWNGLSLQASAARGVRFVGDAPAAKSPLSEVHGLIREVEQQRKGNSALPFSMSHRQFMAAMR